MAACEKIKATGVAPIVTESNISEYDNYWFMYLIERQKGPDFLLKAIEDKTGELVEGSGIHHHNQYDKGLVDERVASPK